MDFLQGLSWLQIFWVAETVMGILAILYDVVTGGFWDKTHGERDPNEPIGWLQFRKR